MLCKILGLEIDRNLLLQDDTSKVGVIWGPNFARFSAYEIKK